MEPENQPAVYELLRRFRQWYPEKTVWCYSGYTFEQLMGKEPSRCRLEITDALLGCIDVLVDGEFVQALYDISLRFRGSSNQRILNLPASMSKGEAVLWQDDPMFAKRSL